MKESGPPVLYSEPVRDIMGNPPGRIVRTGTAVIFILFVLLIVFSWLIKFPDMVPSPVEITTTNPPVTLVSKISGHIKYLYVKDRQKVSEGQTIAIMETTASVDETGMLRNILDTLKNPVTHSLPDFTRLGELQEFYAAFRKNHADLISFNLNDLYGNKILSVNQEIAGLKQYISRLRIKEKLFVENQNIELRKYKRDSSLHAGNIIPDSQLENSYQTWLKNNMDLQDVRLDQSSKLIELAEKQQLVQEYTIIRKEEREKLESLLEQSLLNLRAQMNIWLNNYYLISPVEGIATFTKFWSPNQSVSKDEPVISIVPEDPGDFIGRINLKMQRSGKVKEGQFVNIKLSGFPYLEYGMVRGIVKSKSMVPASDAYIIELDLPEGLRTLYKQDLEFTQNMQGIAEIITEDVRLLQRIVNPFRHMIIKNKR